MRSIIQFGTSRFLQAHVDLFAAEAAALGQQDVPAIVIVQTSGDPARAARVDAFGKGDGYPVIVRGLDDAGRPSERTIRVQSVIRGLQAARDWDRLVAEFVGDAAFVVSNTGDGGFVVPDDDRRAERLAGTQAPTSFPAILLALLHRRWAAGRPPLTILPCELVRRNADLLRAIVVGLATDTGMPREFRNWLDTECLWINTLVDRIVSEAIDPVGAVAEPYALWAIEWQPRLKMPFVHPAIEVTDDLERYERLKLHILNLGHTWLAQRWLDDGGRRDETVGDRLADLATRKALERVYADEVIPAFATHAMGEEAKSYAATTLQRFANPYLDHRLADIAMNHAAKVEKRVGGLLAWVDGRGSCPDMPELRELARQGQKVAA